MLPAKKSSNKEDKVIEPIVFNDPKGLAELIKTDAKDYAEKIVENKKGKDNYTQIRKYYDEIVKIQQQSVICDENEFKKFLPSIYIVAAKSSYAISRKVLTKSFGKFIEKNVKNINTKDDLNNCIMLFEAVIGYIKFFEFDKKK